ncbi:unnamed protein product [Cladocopium goreaui]|uniref:Aldehyde dehydrogenase, dimeric NADP-preferring n=1 Tax=Cladocopium goreaui TaxID=2562237 RepID=A0A9P1FSF3_9DINO|nr:unnamed protein product [Cladocopium goreaui]|mmetsp:Transcript_79279/g.161185  ORF Transcript_79279/g.161185 Transcript_79279/m.161185 type:complete len:465 (-) Transcript_79279:99-1493(-)
MKMLSAVGRTIATPRVLPVEKKISLPVEKRIPGSPKGSESKTFDFNILAVADCSPRTPTSRRHSLQGDQSVTSVASLKTPRVRKRPSMVSQSSSVSQQGQDDRQVDALVSAGVGSWAGSQAVGSLKTGAEGIVEPEELLTGLCPRSDQPQCGNIKEAHLREVENVVVDCEGLLFNVQESDGPKSCSENYVRKNVEFLNALADAGKRLVFCDSANLQVTRERFLEQLQSKGIKKDRCQVWTPACTAAWYLKLQGSVKPLIVSTQAAFVQEMKDLGFKDCLSILEESELIEELSVPDTTAGEDHLEAALKRLGRADAVVIGPLKDMSALMTALIDSILDVVSAQSTWPMLVCCCPPRTRKKMKIMRSSVAGQRLLRGVLHEEFIDAQWPSIMLSAALCDTQRFKPGETLMIGRSFEKTARFAYRAGMSCLLVLDTLEGQLQLTKEMRRECVPDYVAPSLGHVMGID